MRRWIAYLFVAMCMGCGPATVTLENYQKLKPGMTLAEVEAILGPAPQNYQQGIVTWRDGQNRIITVIFDDRGKVDKVDMEGL